MCKKDAIKALLVKLNMVFRDAEIDKDTADIYIAVLVDIDIEKLKSASLTYIKTGKKFPLPADLLELC
jgi:hypothetical protein